MKTLTYLAMALIITSCANLVKFPISTITPAADITASVKLDNNGNNRISITAKNLAGIERLNPPKCVYVVWILTENNGIRNIGKLANNNAETINLETLTPFKFSEIFITAEDQLDASYPSGIEISRIKF
ncbi:MAG: hypothetical protein ACOYMD_01995 [Paludibacter sp.]